MIVELSDEDSLRLNVMLATEPQAIRINESSMTVYALSAQGDAAVRLNPTCRDEPYLKAVREILSGHVMDSPGGYPVFLKRWTRMGQQREDNLDQLLLLGEPEAVIAVVGAQGLTDELARRAWWAMPEAANARRMLQRQCIVDGEMGPVLAEFLVEFLPFETEPPPIIRSVALVLQQDLISQDIHEALWKKGQKRNAYLVGFLQTLPDTLPQPEDARIVSDNAQVELLTLVKSGNSVATQLQRAFSVYGQTYWSTVELILKKPSTQDVINELFDTVAHYLQSICPQGHPDSDLEQITMEVDQYCQSDRTNDATALLDRLPELKGEVKALLIMSRLGYPVVRPVFSKTTAIGSLMRRKIDPITMQLFELIATLRGI